MSTFHVDLTQYVHRCPADPKPHVVQWVRAVVHVQEGGPCQKPFGTDIPCGRVLPRDQQCRACKTHVVIRSTTTVDLDQQNALEVGQ